MTTMKSVPSKEKLINVKVTAKQPNFRRLGRAWPDFETDAQVTEDEFEILKGDKMLVVHVVPEMAAQPVRKDEI